MRMSPASARTKRPNRNTSRSQPKLLQRSTKPADIFRHKESPDFEAVTLLCDREPSPLSLYRQWGRFSHRINYNAPFHCKCCSNPVYKGLLSSQAHTGAADADPRIQTSNPVRGDLSPSHAISRAFDMG